MPPFPAHAAGTTRRITGTARAARKSVLGRTACDSIPGPGCRATWSADVASAADLRSRRGRRLDRAAPGKRARAVRGLRERRAAAARCRLRRRGTDVALPEASRPGGAARRLPLGEHPPRDRRHVPQERLGRRRLRGRGQPVRRLRPADHAAGPRTEDDDRDLAVGLCAGSRRRARTCRPPSARARRARRLPCAGAHRSLLASTCTSTSGFASRLRNQAGWVGAPPFDATTTRSSPSSRYSRGVVRRFPDLRPVVVRSRAPAPCPCAAADAAAGQPVDLRLSRTRTRGTGAPDSGAHRRIYPAGEPTVPSAATSTAVGTTATPYLRASSGRRRRRT